PSDCQTLDLAAANLRAGHGCRDERALYLTADDGRDGVTRGSVVDRFDLEAACLGQQFRSEVPRRAAAKRSEVEFVLGILGALHERRKISVRGIRRRNEYEVGPDCFRDGGEIL